MSSSRNDPRCETDPALNEPWIDVLGKALAGGIPRRTALKILAGAALGSVFGVTAGCGSNSNGNLTDLCPNCGTCAEAHIETTTNTATWTACADSCAAATLCKQASSNSEYQHLADYLTQQGFVSMGAPSKQRTQDPTKGDADIVRFLKDGSLDRSLWQLHYTHPQFSSRSADLYYMTDPSNKARAVALVSESENPSYGLYVNTSGQVIQATPPPTPTPTPTQTTQSLLEEQSPSADRSLQIQMGSSEALNISVLPGGDKGSDWPTLPAIPRTDITCTVACAAICVGLGIACKALLPYACGVFFETPPLMAACIFVAEANAYAICGVAATACNGICREKLCTCDPPCKSCEICVGRCWDGCGIQVCCPDGTCCSGGCCGGGCCNPGRVCCNGTCVSTQQIQRTGSILRYQDQVCCPPGQTPCGSTCCDPTKCEGCVNGSCQSTCGSCQTCDNGQCRNCNSSEGCCNGMCSPSVCIRSDGIPCCVPESPTCCGFNCCVPGANCCPNPNGGHFCCPSNQFCCGGNCCASGETCCKGNCYLPGQNC